MEYVVGQEFSINVGSTVSDVVTPDCVRYDSNDGGELCFTALSVGSGTIRIVFTNGDSETHSVTVVCDSHSDEFSETVPPTCTEQGYDLYECSICGAESKSEFVAALGHNWVAMEHDGFSSGYGYVCSRCGALGDELSDPDDGTGGGDSGGTGDGDDTGNTGGDDTGGTGSTTEDEDLLIRKSTLTSIADAIRAKTGEKDTMKPTEFADKITGIVSGGGSGNLVPLEITENGAYALGGELKYGYTYTLKNDFVQDELRLIYETATEKSDDVVYAFLYQLGGVMLGVSLQSAEVGGQIINAYLPYLSDGRTWLTEEAAMFLGTSAGWNETTDGETFTPLSEPPKVTLEKNGHWGVDISVMTPLFDVSADGFSEVFVIVKSGGVSGDVATVRFLNYDGTELLTRQVFIGDDCPDPVTQGKINTPTRESNTLNTYTYSGWSVTSGGTASASALKNITEDRTVYAAYTTGTRYYTIRYFDGDMLLKTESLAYGAMPSYTPMKDGYTLSGWNPSLSAVTGDMDYSAVWSTKITFAGGTWKDIAEVCESGEAAKHFSVGDTRTVQVTLGTTTFDFELEIIGINHDDLADGSGKAGITIGSKNSLHVFDFNLAGSSQNNYKFNGGWATSALRTAFNSTLIDAFPSEMTQYIKEVIKKSVGSSNTLTDIVTTSDKMFIPSVSEFTGNSHDTGSQYALYKDVNNRKKCKRFKSTLTTEPVAHGTRTQNTSNPSTYIYGIETDGTFTGAVHSIESFVVCFCL